MDYTADNRVFALLFAGVLMGAQGTLARLRRFISKEQKPGISGDLNESAEIVTVMLTQF